MVRQKNLFLAFVLVFLLVLPFSLAQLVSVGEGSTGTVNVEGNDNGGITIGEPEYQEACGNGIVDYSLGETCDGLNLGGVTCVGLGFNGGTLSCKDLSAGNNKCTLNNQCTNIVAPNPEVVPTSGGGGGGSGGGSSGGGSSSSCVENWTCSEWGECTEGIQTRTCVDNKKCSTTKIKPLTQRECSVEGMGGDQGIGAPATEKGFFSWLTGAVTGPMGKASAWALIILLILLALAYWFIAAKKKKKAEVKPVRVKNLSEVRAANKAKAATKKK